MGGALDQSHPCRVPGGGGGYMYYVWGCIIHTEEGVQGCIPCMYVCMLVMCVCVCMHIHVPSSTHTSTHTPPWHAPGSQWMY